MSDAELGHELLTLLLAGHETTATALAWAVERLRSPAVLERLVDEIDAADERNLDAVVKEVPRSRTVVLDTPRLLDAPASCVRSGKQQQSCRLPLPTVKATAHEPWG
jgi:cytochrome P450 family 135